MPRNRGQGDLRLTREGGGRMVLRRNGVEIGNADIERFLLSWWASRMWPARRPPHKARGSAGNLERKNVTNVVEGTSIKEEEQRVADVAP